MPANLASAEVKNPTAPDARPLVDRILQSAFARSASDIHVEPLAHHYEIRFRVDGLLEIESTVDVTIGRSIVARLMVMAKLLTYRLDIPQEGRLTTSVDAREFDLRVAIMPTTHGLRAAVRLPADLIQPQSLAELSLPPATIQGLKDFATRDSGLLLLTGPAGSGKTTTIYALLQYIIQTSPGLSIVALEDPVERDIPGITQIEVSPFGQLTYERALRSILRQDPQVLMLGEIRDSATATLALQAALSGHRLISTFHASTAAGAIARLIEMGAEPYQITSALYGVISQRLVRKKSPTGYAGRVPIAEFVEMNEAARTAVLNREGSDAISKTFDGPTLASAAEELIKTGVTDHPEIARVLGTPSKANL